MKYDVQLNYTVTEDITVEADSPEEAYMMLSEGILPDKEHPFTLHGNNAGSWLDTDLCLEMFAEEHSLDRDELDE